MLKSITGKLQTKLIIAFALVLLIPITIIGLYVVNSTSTLLIKTATANELDNSRRETQRIEDALAHYTDDVRFLANSSSTQNYVAGVSLNNPTLIKDGLYDVQQSFLAYSQAFGVYDQIRLLDKAGKELVRVNFKNGKATLIDAANLQNKADQNYFQNAINLPTGQVYISPISLNQDNGKIEQPYKPVLSYATPVYTKSGSVVGVVVTNVLADSFLSLVIGDVPTEKAYLIDSDGTYLAGPDPSQLYGRDLKTTSNFLRDHPKDGLKFVSAELGASFGSEDRPDQLQIYSRVIPPNQEASIQWTLYHTQPTSNFLGEVQRQQLAIFALALIALLVAVTIAFLITRSIVRPVQRLVLSANEISAGNWGVEVPSAGRDEIGELATAFGKMSKDLQTIYGSLEDRVRERTVELETVADVSTATATILDVDKLLKSVVDLTKASFGYYHAHIYLLDASGKNLVLAAGAGEPGRIMKAEGRSIPLNHQSSLVARAGRTRQGVIANDVTQAPDFLPNKLLPNTRSELAVPMIVADELIGILDVQSEKVNRFTPEDIRVKTTLASQVAVAVRNAGTFQETREAREEANVLYEISTVVNAVADKQQLVDAVVPYLVHPHTDSMTLTRFENGDYDSATYAEIVAGWQSDNSKAVFYTKIPLNNFAFLSQMDRHNINYVDDTNNNPTMDESTATYLKTLAIQSFVFVPLTVGGRWIGNLSITSSKPHVHGEREIRLLRGVGEQMTSAIERLLLIEQTDARAAALETVAKVSAATSSILDLDTLLQTVVDLTKENFDLYHAHIYLIDDQNKYLRLTAGAGEPGRVMKAEGRRIAIQNASSLVARAGRTHQAVIVNDVAQTPDFLPNPLLPDTQSELAVPILAGDTLIGVLDVQSEHLDRFTQADVSVNTTLAGQISGAIQNASAFTETQKAREEAKTLYDISSAINAAENEQQLVESIAQYVAQSDTLSVSLAVFEHADYDSATYSQITARWSAEGSTLTEHLPRYPRNVFPFMERVDRQNVNFVDDTNNDAFLDEVSVSTFKGLGVQAVIFAPLTLGNRWVGSLSILSSEPHVHTEREKRLLRGITQQTTTAIERLRLIDQTNIRAAELETVAKVSAATSSILHVDELLQTVVNLTKESFNLYHAHVYLLDDQGEYLVLAAGAGEPGRIMKANGLQIALNHQYSLVARAGRTQLGVIVNDVTKAPDFLPNKLLPNTRSELAVPIIAGDTLLGVLDVQSEKLDRFTAADVSVQTTLAGQISVAVQNARAFTQTQEAREEANILYEISTVVNAVSNKQQLVDAVVSYLAHPYTDSITLTRFEDGDYDNATYAEIVAGWQSDKSRAVFYTKIPLNNFAFLTQMDRHNINYVDDTSNSPTMDEATATFLKTLGIQSFVFVPLTFGGRWIGNLSITSSKPHVHGEREIRLLRGVGEQMTSAVERLLLIEQTDARAAALETVAKVSSATSSILDVDTLLQTVVDLTKENFDLYHAHVYLLDERGDYLALAAGAGEPGRIMKAENRRIAIRNQNSLVARAARTREAVIVNDITQTPDFLPNPLLPNTRSELAVPILAGDALLGVLDVQSEQLDRFTQADVSVNTTLSGQISIAVQNARAFTETQEAREEAKTLYDISSAINAAETEQALVDTIAQFALQPHTASMSLSIFENADFDSASYSLVAGEWPFNPAANTLNTKTPVALFPFVQHTNRYDVNFINDVNTDQFLDEVSVASLLGIGIQAMIFAPLTVGDRWIGSFSMISLQPHVYSEREKRLLRGVTKQMTTAIERLRLIRQTDTRAAELETVAKVSAATSSILDIDTLLQTVVDLTKESFDLYHAHIYLLDDEGTYLVLASGAGEPGRVMRNEGRRLSINNKNSLVARAARSQQGVIVNDVTQATDFLPNALLPNTRSELAVPMIVGNNLIGVLDIQAEEVDRFTEADARIQTTLAEQIAVAVENARYITQIKLAESENEKRAKELETVAKISTAATTLLDLDEMLQTVVDLTKTDFDLYHAHIYLVDDTERNLMMVAGAGEIGRAMKAEGRRISLGNEYSLVARAVRTRTAIIANDVAQAEDFLPNPLLPNTRSEMAVPMILGSRVIGVLDVQSDEVGRFTAEDMSVKSTLASQIAVAVENSRLYQTQVESAEQLRQIDRLKSEFLANMSHELRTPLNSIIGYAEVMLDGIDGDLPDEAMEDVEAIHGSGQHLLSMINDILDLAKIEAGRMELDLDTVHFADVAAEVQQITSILLKDKPVELVLDIDPDLPDVWADQVRLRQVLNNLVSNASKFTNEGEIRVRAAYAGEQQFADGIERGMILVEVIDTGEGIAPENQDLVFQQFRQADSSSTRKAGGTGMGLAITRHLVQMHGGELSLTSQVGVGSNFWFTMPIVQVSVAGD